MHNAKCKVLNEKIRLALCIKHFLMSLVDEIKSRLDIVEVIGQSVQLKKAGRNYKAICPFHNEKTPSLVVFPDQGTWHCFGACGTGGDVFTFVMKKDNVDFGEALRILAERAGVELHRGDGEQNRQVLLDIHTEAVAFYHYLLKTHAAAQFAREYLEHRRISKSSVEQFQLGFAPNTHTALQDHLERKGFRTQDIERAGLALANETGGGYHDRFRGRLMFPIRNRRGQTIAFGARALAAGQNPKYLNSPDTPLFNKSDVLYGLDLAKDAIREQNLAVIVEGYTDVIVAHQAGFKNVVASLGTALTEKQLSQLQRLTKRYALALDADVAGEAATARGLELARAALSRKQVPVPVGAGMIAFEERLDAELLIIELPRDRDPDEVILQDAAEWQQLVARAVPLVDYYFREQTRELDLRSAHGKAEAVRRLAPIVGEIKDPVQRAHYVQELARLVQVDERTLTQQLKLRGADAKLKQKRQQLESAPPRPSARYDEHLLALALYDPSLLPRVKFLTPDDFEDGARREIWSALQRHAAAPASFDADEFLDTLSSAARAEGEKLREQARQFDHSEIDAARELETAAYRLKLRRYSEELVQLQYLLNEPSAEDAQMLYRRADVLRARMAEAQRALGAYTAAKSTRSSIN